MQGTERRYLVLVVGLLAGPGPAAELYRLSKEHPSRFRFVVPVTKPDYGWTWTEEDAFTDAMERLEIMLEFGTAMGMQVSGEVARTDDPVDAARVIAEDFDEIVLIDNPHGLRHWGSDRALSLLASDPGLPLRHYEGNPGMKQGKDFDLAELRYEFRYFVDELKKSEGDPAT